MRPGERLNEILFASEEPTVEIGVAGIMAAKPNEPPMQTLRKWLAALEQAIARDDRATIKGGAEGCRAGIRIERRLIFFRYPPCSKASPSPPAMRAVSKAKMEKFRKVVVVSQHYSLDPSTTAAIMAAFRNAWRRRPKSWCSRERGHGGVRRQACVVEVGNWMPAKAALVRRTLAELLFTLPMFIALLMKLRRGDVALTVPVPFMLPYAFAAAG